METITMNRHIPLSKFDQFYPWPSIQSMRNRIYTATKYGDDELFLACIEWCAGRVMVNENNFNRWLEYRIEQDTKLKLEKYSEG